MKGLLGLLKCDGSFVEIHWFKRSCVEDEFERQVLVPSLRLERPQMAITDDDLMVEVSRSPHPSLSTLGLLDPRSLHLGC